MEEKELLRQAIEFIKGKGLYKEFKESLPTEDELRELGIDKWVGLIK